jgi:formyltetrahydrofolate synthetase
LALDNKDAIELDVKVIKGGKSCKSKYLPIYNSNSRIINKISAIAKNIYGAVEISCTSKARNIIKRANNIRVKRPLHSYGKNEKLINRLQQPF